MIFDFIVSNINAWNKSVSILETVTYGNKYAYAVGSDYVQKKIVSCHIVIQLHKLLLKIMFAYTWHNVFVSILRNIAVN